MLRRLRENGPAVLVPLAWTFVTAAHLDFVAQRTLLIAHVVMATLLLAFAALSWTDMRSGALLVWRRVIVLGFFLTVAGAFGLVLSSPSLLGLAVVGWMVLPAAGLWDTGRRGARPARAYRAGGALSGLGAVAYVLAPVVGSAATLVGLLLVGVGQTAGIVAAVVAD
ncbi:hypothetical protein [Haloplanus aerogenes]|uniref:Uncharacterized protein n=1 Tax=Haloplanus aerogenes TaxID=660522 RepID=A0A3M0DVD1_9EURY|nr:hypothetical protein [Haloplanus aerogenes]AZH24546.1 hypothetical protein DU502_03735 [Haloplanus aerogenes]RMB23799.1 hypothetical protein ATH50_1029 [Haloplanus aerogenes]